MMYKQLNRMTAMRRSALAGLMLWVCAGIAAPLLAAERVVFTTPPTQPVEKTQELYGPLAAWLSEVTGAEVVLVPARNFLEYTNNMRQGQYDLIFDGPHFVSWRMLNLEHEPIARLPGELVFVLAAREDAGISDVSQLVGKKLCALASPNLATLAVLDYFPNPSRQPILVPVKSFKDSLQCALDNKALAGVMPIHFWKKWTKEGETQGLKVVLSTAQRPLPPRTFSISKKVSPELRAKIAAALLDAEGKPGAKPVLDRFRKKNFTDVKSDNFEGLHRLLRQVWGFDE